MRQQFCVGIDWSAADDGASQRVQGIVFDNAKNAPGSQNAEGISGEGIAV